MKTSNGGPMERGSRDGDSPEEAAQRFFRQSPYHSLRGLECRFHEGVLTIQGSVPSFYLKQVAQTAAQQIEGVEEVENQVEVGS